MNPRYRAIEVYRQGSSARTGTTPRNSTRTIHIHDRETGLTLCNRDLRKHGTRAFRTNEVVNCPICADRDPR